MKVIDAGWILQTTEAIGVELTLPEAERLAPATEVLIQAAQSEADHQRLEDEPSDFARILGEQAEVESEG